ncbi:MAG: porin family protein [Acidiferrobacterales bacterium]|nr:porin family protein [Acidiferrobacterales bacterium]
MKKIVFLSLISASIIFCNQSFADSPTFSYVELEYIANGDFSVSDESLAVDLGLDGYALTGSVELGIFLIQASRYELKSAKILDSNLEDSISTIALGLTFELPQTSVYGLVRARRDELSLVGGGFDEDETGNTVGFEVGARVNLTDRFEINANIGKPSVDEGSAYGVGAQFYITDNIGITLDFSSIEVEDEEEELKAEFNTTSIGLRYNF